MRLKLACGVALFLSLALTTTAWSLPGDLDTTGFNAPYGAASLNSVAHTDDFIEDVAVQGDGKVVVAGYSRNRIADQYDLFVARYTAAGVLDAGFATGGVYVMAGTAAGAFGNAVALQADGKILAAGGTSGGMTVIRLTEAGLLDDTFGTDLGGSRAGYVELGNSRAVGLAVRPDGKILVAGERSGIDGTEIVLAQLTAAGDLDTAGFNAPNGSAVYAPGYAVNAADLALCPPGSVTPAGGEAYIAGYFIHPTLGTNDLLVLRYTTAGTLDATFGGGDGVATYDSGDDESSWDVAVRAGGGVVVAGETYNGSNSDILLLALDGSGAPDTAFSGDGVAIWDGGSYDVGYGVAVQADGKVAVVGSSVQGVSPDTLNQVVLLRFDAAGALDTAGFASPDGFALHDTGYQSQGMATALSGTDLVVAGRGQSVPNGLYDGVLLRYSSSGSLDASFGSAGAASFDRAVSAVDAWHDLAAQPDGKVVALGETHDGLNTDVLLARYLPDGTLDTSFGTNGVVTWGRAPSDLEVGWAVAIREGALPADRRIAVAAQLTSNGEVAVLLFDDSGALDTSFADSGVFIWTPGGGGGLAPESADLRPANLAMAVFDLSFDGSGKIVVAASANGDGSNNLEVKIIRLLSTGALDTGFGSGGVVSWEAGPSPSALARGIAIDPRDGGILVSGTSYNDATSSSDIFVLRLDSAGSFDAGFDGDGVASYDHGSDEDAYRLAVQPDGKVLVAGGSNGLSLLLLRFGTDGSLDAGFGSSGVVSLAGRSAFGVALQPDGKILLSGTKWSIGGARDDVLVARFDSAGAPDPTFDGSDGVIVLNSPFTADSADTGENVILDSAGNIVVAAHGHTGTYPTEGDEDALLFRVVGGARNLISDARLAEVVGYPDFTFDTVELEAGSPALEIRGSVQIDGVTDDSGQGADVLAELGWGPDGSDPATDVNWVWSSATYFGDSGSKDVYSASLSFDEADAGSHDFVYRFSHGGAVWVYGGLSGSYEGPDDAGDLLVTLPPRTLTVSLAGSGSGAVSSVPGGIACPGDCDEIYADGTSVTIAAAPNPGSIFTGWSGACSGTDACALTLDGDRDVTATFVLYTPVTRTVCASGCDHDTLADALAAAGPGDTIRLAAGSHATGLTIDASSLVNIEGGWDPTFTVQSPDPGLTILDGGSGTSVCAGRVISVAAGDGETIALSLENLTVTGGCAPDAGGISATAAAGGAAAVTLRKVFLTGNRAANGSGGGLLASADSGGDTSLLVENSIVSANEASGSGGGLAVSGSPGTVALVLSGSTVTDNRADVGGGVALFAAAAATVVDTILWGNAAATTGGDLHLADTAAAAVSASDIGDLVDDAGGFADGGGNISDDPLFQSPAAGDWRLNADSPCIDSGAALAGVVEDFEGQARPAGGLFDIGADEYHDYAVAKVRLLGPNGGEQLTTGGRVNVTWEAHPDATQFKLTYTTNNGKTWTSLLPRRTTVGGRHFAWDLPLLRRNGTKCRVKIKALRDNGSLVGSDVSDKFFAIGVVRVTAPTAGETLVAGRTYRITWESGVPRSSVERTLLYYTTNGGATWKAIDRTVPKSGDPGFYDWTVPVSAERRRCKVKVVLQHKNGARYQTVGVDTSDGYFTIGPDGS